MSALTVLYLVLPFPIAFLVHDLEETFVQRSWMERHREMLMRRFPRLRSLIEQLNSLSTKAFAIAAAEELLILLAATCYLLVDAPFALEVWAALFLAFSVHLVVHIAQGLILRSYVPGLISAVLLLPYSGLGVSSLWRQMGIGELIALTIAGLLVLVLNLRFAHWLGRRWGNRKKTDTTL